MWLFLCFSKWLFQYFWSRWNVLMHLITVRHKTNTIINIKGIKSYPTSMFLRAWVAFFSCWMGIRGKPPILGFLVIERFRSFPAGGRISFSCCGNTIACRWCVILLCGVHHVTWSLDSFPIYPNRTICFPWECHL